MKNISETLEEKFSKIERQADNGFRDYQQLQIFLEEAEKLSSEMYHPRFKGELDSDVFFIFPDNSAMLVANPFQVCFSAFAFTIPAKFVAAYIAGSKGRE